jgi:hypothetical protein
VDNSTISFASFDLEKSPIHSAQKSGADVRYHPSQIFKLTHHRAAKNGEAA